MKNFVFCCLSIDGEILLPERRKGGRALREPSTRNVTAVVYIMTAWGGQKDRGGRTGRPAQW